MLNYILYTLQLLSAAFLFVSAQESPAEQFKEIIAFGDSLTDIGYLFWDDVHPTTQGHQVVAGLALKALLSTQF